MDSKESNSEPEFVNLLRSPGIDSARLFSLAGRYDNPIPTRLKAQIDCFNIPAQGNERLRTDRWLRTDMGGSDGNGLLNMKTGS